MSVILEILEQLDRSREQLLVAIEPLPDEAYLLPEAVGDWSVADVLANLAAWESELVTGLMQLEQGVKPVRLLAALAQPAAYDAQRYMENKGRDLDRIFDDFQGVRVKLEERLESFSDRDLANPKRYKSLNGKSLREIIKAASFGREMTFVSALQAYTRHWLDEFGYEDAAYVEPDGVIPLSTILWERDDDEEE